MILHFFNQIKKKKKKKKRLTYKPSQFSGQKGKQTFILYFFSSYIPYTEHKCRGVYSSRKSELFPSAKCLLRNPSPTSKLYNVVAS